VFTFQLANESATQLLTPSVRKCLGSRRQLIRQTGACLRTYFPLSGTLLSVPRYFTWTK